VERQDQPERQRAVLRPARRRLRRLDRFHGHALRAARDRSAGRLPSDREQRSARPSTAIRSVELGSPS
jgi:hypothetical protein